MHGRPVVGLLSRAALVRAMMTAGPESYVAGAMDRDFARVSPDMPLTEALPLVAGPAACALVMDGEDRLLGMLTSENLSEFLLLRQMSIVQSTAQAPHHEAHRWHAGMSQTRRVVIVGGGFGGLYAAKKLGRAPVDVTLIDRRNFHLFQPLLYQVATGALSPGEIASPLRVVLKKNRNTEVLLGEVMDLDVEHRRVILRDGEAPYDDLIVATGATHHYFGNDQWVHLAPGLKTVEDATEIRSRMLLAFERAEREPDPKPGGAPG